MSIVHDLQQLIARSRLFVTEDKLAENKSRNAKSRGRGRGAREAIKVGQGGTLDPLADGVLGELVAHHLPSIMFPEQVPFQSSNWCW